MSEAKPRFTASRAIPLTVGACFFMEGLDSTIIATSLPRIADSLDVGANEIGIALTAYLVSVSLWMAASGWLADRFEARRVFIAAVVLFVAGSVLCGFAQNLTHLVIGRFVQGMGGALMTPVGRLILARSFPRDELVRAMSYMIVPGLLGPMIGPVVGGWITTFADWRWIFFINVPLGIVGVGLALGYLRRVEAPGSARFDGLGFVLVAGTLLALQAGLEIVAAESALDTRAAAALGVATLGLAAYVRHARRADPILDLRMFQYRAYAISVLGGSFSRAVLGATMFLFPLYVQYAMGGSVLVAGYLMAVLAVGQIALRLGLDPLLRRLGIRRLLVFNSAAMGVLLAGLLMFGRGDSFWLLGGFLFAFGLIHSIQLSTLAGLNFSGLPTDALGRATSISAVVQRIAMAFGISLTAILLGGAAAPEKGDFVVPVLVLSGLMLLSLVSFLGLKAGDGDDLLKKSA